MDCVICYDIAETDQPSGSRRLREVSNTIAQWGIRVQQSVWEARVSPTEMSKLRNGLDSIINHELDSVTIYVLHADMEECRDAIGREPVITPGGTLLV